MAEEKEPIQWVTKKNWDEFRQTGLGWFINSILHAFGWAIVWDVDDVTGNVTGCYPARVKFRGFSDKDQDESHRKIGKYLEANATALREETELE